MLLLTALRRMILVSKQDRVVRVDAVILFFRGAFRYHVYHQLNWD